MVPFAACVSVSRRFRIRVQEIGRRQANSLGLPKRTGRRVPNPRAPASAGREFPVAESCYACIRQEPVPVEYLVHLTLVVPPRPPKRPQDRQRTGCGNGVVKLSGGGRIERYRGRGERVDARKEFVDTGHLDEFDRRCEYPLEFCESRRPPMTQGQGRQAHDDHHGGHCASPRAPRHPYGEAARYRGSVPKAPQSRSGRYEALATGALVDCVERSYERDEVPDWELVFELSRRAMDGERQSQDHGVVGSSRQR